MVALSLAGQAFVASFSIGTQTDEPSHVQRMNNWFETGWYLPERLTDDAGQPLPEIDLGRIHAYGAGFSLAGHAVAVLAGAEEPGETNTTAAAYEARSVTLVLIALGAVAALGYALLVTTGSWWPAAFGAAALLASPLWTGYSTFAIKDIPAGAGWTFVTVALILALRPTTARQRVLVGVLCAVGLWFTMGVRTALWVPVAASIATYLVLAAAGRVRGRRLWANLSAVGSGLAAGIVAIAVVHPRNAATPVRWLVDSVTTSGDFHWTGTTLTAGQLLPEKPPWWYLPAWGLGSVPTLLVVLAVLGAVIVVVTVLVRSGGDGEGPVRARLGDPRAGDLLWLQQALLLPTVATVGGATMYAGFRHHLYVLPALAALGALGAWWLASRTRARWHAGAVGLVLVAALAIPAVEQTRLFPHSFVYKNAIAGPVEDRWETDMHWVSAREAIARVPEGEAAYCYGAATRQPTGEIVAPSMRACDEQPQIAPFIAEQGTEATSGPEVADGRTWVVGRRYRGSPPAPGCEEQDNVTRPLRGEELTISYVLLCDPDVVG